MANTPQAKKRIRRNANRSTINHSRISRIRTFIREVESAIASGKKAEAAEALTKVQPEIARGVARGVIHKNTAARNFSRLSKRLASLG
jgi:small subunit ribosomal protein S20